MQGFFEAVPLLFKHESYIKSHCFESFMFDIVIPDNNEHELLKMAHRLGYKQLLFLYRKPAKQPETELPVKTFSGVLITKPTQQYAGLITAVQSSQLDKQFLELKQPPTIMFDFELSQLPDTMHWRTSGLDQVLCKMAAGKTRIYFTFKNILATQGMKQARLLGRIMQNIMLCRKYKVEMGVASFASDPLGMRSPHDLRSLFQLLGMTQVEAKLAMQQPVAFS